MRPIRTSFWERTFYRRINKTAFLVGNRWEIKIQIENLNVITFQGGTFRIFVRWPNSKLEDHYIFSVPQIPPQGESNPFIFEFGLIEPGYGLIHLQWLNAVSGSINLHVGGIYHGHRSEAHIESVYAQTKEEFYQLYDDICCDWLNIHFTQRYSVLVINDRSSD